MGKILGWALVLGVCLAGIKSTSAVVVEPGDLLPGDTYRLVFVTQGATTPTSTSIGDYDAFVSGEAALSTDLAALGTGWRVLGSTATVDAKTHTQTDPVADGAGVPIYNLAGERISDGNLDLWIGILDNAIRYDQFGNTVNLKVFTGTAADGVSITDQELGSNVARVRYGYAANTDGSWTSSDWLGNGVSLQYYGISDVLTVVPEPGTLGVLIVGASAMIRRSRRT